MPADRRAIDPGLVGAAAVVVALAGLWLWVSALAGPWQLATGLLDARTHLRRADKLLSDTAIKAAGGEALAALAAARRAQGALDGPDPLLDLARIVPRVNEALHELPHLVRAAAASAQAAASTIEVAQTVLRGPDSVIADDPTDPEGGSVIRLDRIEEIADTIAGARELIHSAEEELRLVDPSRLPRKARDAIAEGIRKTQSTEKVLADAAAGLAVLPGFLGADEPRTYLIGMQNTAEQRGTGGAILQFALLSITEGKPTLPEARGSVYDVDRGRQQVSIELPEDAFYVAGIPDAQRFGNSNWSPDWPASARLMLDYAYASDPNFPQIDGVIAVDPVVMQHLMPGVGKYRSSAGNLITTKRVVHFLLYKAYASFPVSPIRRVVLRSVVDGFFAGMLDPDHPTLMIEGLGAALDGKDMQVWLADPTEQAFIERMAWDGGIKTAARGDYIYVVEQNVGGNKLDYFAHDTNTVTVDLNGDDALVSSEVRIRNDVFLPQPRWSMGDTGRPAVCFERAACPLHRAMVNVYVPERAELTGWDVEGTRVDTPAPAVWVDGRPAQHTEGGKTVWSATLEIPPGDEGAFRLDYTVPDAVVTRGGRKVYRLVVQHQPKVQAERLIVEVELPPGAGGVRAKGFTRRGDTLVWDRELSKDLVLEVSWRG